jgi:hypothetical protein
MVLLASLQRQEGYLLEVHQHERRRGKLLEKRLRRMWIMSKEKKEFKVSHCYHVFD